MAQGPTSPPMTGDANSPKIWVSRARGRQPDAIALRIDRGGAGPLARRPNGRDSLLLERMVG